VNTHGAKKKKKKKNLMGHPAGKSSRPSCPIISNFHRRDRAEEFEE